MRESFGAGQFIGLVFVFRAGEGGDGDGSDVADIDDADPGISRGSIEGSLRRDGGTEIEQGLHEQVRAQERIGDARFQNVMLHPGVIAREAPGCDGVCA